VVSLSIRRFGAFGLRLAVGILAWLPVHGHIPAAMGQTNRASQRNDRVGRLIGRLTDPNREVRLDAVSDLRETIRDSEMREAAVETRNRASHSVTIGEIIDPRIVGALIGALKDSDSEVRADAATALGEAFDPRAAEPLIASLSDNDTIVRYSAVDALGSIADPRAVGPLISMLGDPKEAVGYRAAEALGNIKDPRAVEPLIAALTGGKSIVREWAARALGQIKDSRAIAPLIGTLKQADEDVAESAAKALGEIGSPAVEPLVAELNQTNSDFTSNVDDALSNIGGPAEDALIECLRDSDPNVRMNAAYSLSGIADSRASTALAGFEERNVVLAARNYSSFIAKGEPGTEDLLIQAINRLGNRRMALAFIVCGNPKLEGAGGDWASAHGYYKEEFYGIGGSPSVGWHSAH
jgi:HEAT repeat protein